jgi:hypothetical protein
MDLEKTTQRLKKDLDLFGLDHRCSKLQLYRNYQRYLKEWKLDNFENIDQKLSASKKIDKAHESYDFIKTNWNYLVFLKNKEDSYDRMIIIIVFIFLFIMMMTYMQTRANKRVRIARQEAVSNHEADWAWTHGMSDSLVKLSKSNALDDFWGKVILDTNKISDLLTFWPHSLNRHNQNKVKQEILSGASKHTVFPNEEYQRKSTSYKISRALTVANDKVPKILLERISFYRNHYEIILSYHFENIFKNQKILEIDLGPFYIIEPKYYPYSDKEDSVWTKKPKYPLMLDGFMEDCVKCGGGILFLEDKPDDYAACVFRFMVSLPYETNEILIKGVGSPLDDVPINIKPYVNKLKDDWFEKIPYRPLEWRMWKPLVLRN